VEAQPLREFAMAEDARLILACALALTATGFATPVAIALARMTGFYDHPAGYKKHASATPYLGGAAVVFGLVVGSLAFGIGWHNLGIALAAAVALLAIGTLDDRVNLGIGVRLGAEVATAAALYFAGLGWSVFHSGAADFVLTVAFVVAVVNAYNLMDNLDGATPSVAAVAAAAIGLYAAAEGAFVVALLGLGLAGACAGFLPYNLAVPRARIFLGDGGSMAIGVTLAALMMSVPASGNLDLALIPVAVVLVGLPAFDTALVIFSRLRRGENVLSGGRDHLSHRLYERLNSTRRVAAVLATGQVACCCAAFALLQVGPALAAVGAGAVLASAATAIVAIDVPGWLPRMLAPLRDPAAARDEWPA
jgi:UDP-GlcNAc:undecaprenyl-phosphate GlcNAc-1-phosphate transferase